MAFKDIIFPIDVSRGAVGGPGYQTDVVVVEGGQEFRNQPWEQPRGSWEVSQAAKLPAKYKPLQAFFLIAAGKANSFRFRDWADYIATTDGVFIMLTSTTFQMAKRYTFAGQTFDRIITKPESPSVITGGASPVVDYATGIVTVSSGTPTAWAGQFHAHARFDIDQMRGDIVDRNNAEGLIISWESIPIVELRD